MNGDAEPPPDWLEAFDLSWSAGLLDEYAGAVPPGVGRRAALIELAKIDLERHWRRGTKVRAGDYTRFPELGSADAPPDELIRAEQEIRAEYDRSVLGGRYWRLRRLGAGCMGEVHLARDMKLDRLVALKVPRFEGGAAEVRARFWQEARAAAQFDHPNLVRVIDMQEVDGADFLIMPYVGGRPLSELVGPDRPVGLGDAVRWVRGMAGGLAAAHERGVVHRDLKPANVILTEDGEPVVVDFGLALCADPGRVRLTQTGEEAAFGTPAYMAPEQVRGELDRIGPRTDVYALGVILYELLTGVVPFPGATRLDVSVQILTAPPPLPSDRRPDLPPWVDAVCLRALAKQPEDRFPTMVEFAAALAAADDGRGDLSPPPPPGVRRDDRAGWHEAGRIDLPGGVMCLAADPHDPRRVAWATDPFGFGVSALDGTTAFQENLERFRSNYPPDNTTWTIQGYRVIWRDEYLEECCSREASIRFVGISPRHPLLAVEHDKALYFRNLVTGAPDHLLGEAYMCLQERGNARWAVAWHPSGDALYWVSGDDTGLCRKKTRPNTWTFREEPIDPPVDLPPDPRALAFDRSGSRLAVGSGGGLVCIYDTDPMEKTAEFAVGGSVSRLAFLTAGELVVLLEPADGGAADGRVKVWQPVTGRKVRDLAERAAPGVLAVSPDGRWVAWGDGADGCVRDMQADWTGRLPGHSAAVTAAAFAADGSRLFTGGSDGVVRGWEVC